MGLFTTNKEDKKPPEPQYYLSATNIPTYNYKVYYMSVMEKILYFILAFAVGAATGRRVIAGTVAGVYTFAAYTITALAGTAD